MEIFCKDLKEHATKITFYEKKELIPLADEKNKSYQKSKVCYICTKELNIDETDKNAFKYHKVKDHCIYTGKCGGAAHSICNLRYKKPTKIPIVFYNGSKYIITSLFNSQQKDLRVNLNTQEKMQKHILRFQYRLKKKLYFSETITY